MSQVSIHHILHHALSVNGGIDIAYLQKVEKLPEYSELSLEEKNALALMNSDSIISFLSSAAVRRDDSEDANRIS
jgi:hypothetical protein